MKVGIRMRDKPAFIKKHYQAMAGVIRLERDEAMRERMARLLGFMLSYDNPRFNSTTWMAACEVQLAGPPSTQSGEWDAGDVT